MSTYNLDCILKPERIALIGVSINPKSVSAKVLSNIVGSGYRGVVYPINETSEAIMGISCFSNLESLPRTPDLAVICTEAKVVPSMVKACGEANIKGIIIMSAGFKEIGEEGLLLEEEIKKIRLNYPGMRIIGPNCLGIIVPALNLNLSFAPIIPKKGNIAFISQSGALCTSILDWAKEENIGFSTFISLGNTIDVNFGDLIDYLGVDESTSSIILYIESITKARKFISASRAFAQTKPIIVYKAGRFPESAAVAASHTGALAAEDIIYDAVFQRTAITRVYDIGEIFDCAALIGRNKIPKGDKLAIVTNAGGPGVMATDALIEANGSLADLSDETMERLNDSLPPMWSHRNPVDVIGDDVYKRLVKATEIVLEDINVDAVLVILTPQAMTNIKAAAKAIGMLQEKTKKPILASWLGGFSMKEGSKILNDFNIASFKTPEQAVRSFMTLVSYARNLKTLYETPKNIPVEFSLNREEISLKFDEILKDDMDILSEEKSKRFLQAYGIPVTLPVNASSVEELIKVSNEIKYPVVLKVNAKEITHKSDLGGVKLNIKNDDQAEKAYNEIIQKISQKMPDITLDGVTVQPMINLKNSIELILGIKKDDTFGTIILVGAGGITAELLVDRTIGLPPLNESLVRRMLEGLKIWPLLNGYRGSEPVNLDKLIEVIIRLSYIAADHPIIKELDINPLIVSSDDIIALDARIVIDRKSKKEHGEKYDHLSIVPYPEEYIAKPILIDNTKVTFRPIKPEDEPMWFELLASCSKESIYSRFNYFLQWSFHEVATRYCYIDYDREIAIVAEIEEEGKKALIGVGRLIADIEHKTVEYAILVTDKWQNKELGSRLTDYCLEISEKWGLNKVVAQTTSDNYRIINLFKKRGFEITHDNRTSTVFIEKEIKSN